MYILLGVRVQCLVDVRHEDSGGVPHLPTHPFDQIQGECWRVCKHRVRREGRPMASKASHQVRHVILSSDQPVASLASLRSCSEG